MVVSDLKAEAAKKVADIVQKSGGSTVAVSCNVIEDAARKLMVERALDAFSKITILVNNAGGGGAKPFDMPMETFIWAYQLNVFSVFHPCQLCAPHMAAEGGGAILNISSMAGREQESKHGILQLLQSRRKPSHPKHRI